MIDSAALTEVLDSGHVGGAVLNVERRLRGEPLERVVDPTTGY